jgi:hypothetical protein
MHNLHYLTIKADSPREACDIVENIIVEWGNENNWRSICGCISEDNEIYIHDEADSFAPGKTETLSDVTKRIKSWVDNFQYDSVIKEKLVKFQIEEEALTANDWWLLQQYCKFKEEQVKFKQHTFALWQSEYRSWELDECGLTNLMEHNDAEKRYVVFLNMHS